MLYYIVNVEKNQTVAICQSKLEVLSAHAEHTPAWTRAYMFLKVRRGEYDSVKHTYPVSYEFDFSDFNPTGKDMKLAVVERKEHWDFRLNVFLPVFVYGLFPRAYAVIDAEGRHQDIRIWANEIAYILKHGPCQKKTSYRDIPLPEFRREPAIQGRKGHHHRLSGPSMWRNTMRDITEVTDEMDEVEFTPVVDRSKARSRGLTPSMSWDIAEEKYFGRYHKRSWKDSTKSPRQWCKHKKNVRKKSLGDRKKYVVPKDINFEDIMDDWCQCEEDSGYTPIYTNDMFDADDLFELAAEDLELEPEDFPGCANVLTNGFDDFDTRPELKNAIA